MLQKLRVIILLLDVADLLLVLHLAPRQLPRDELHHHVEQRPQVVMTTHLLHMPSTQQLCRLVSATLIN